MLGSNQWPSFSGIFWVGRMPTRQPAGRRRYFARIRNFFTSGTSRSSRQALSGVKTLEDFMNKIVGKLMVMCVLAVSLNAFAQSTTESNQDSMKHEDMKQDTMKKDEMKHDDMSKDDMAKNKKAKKLKKDKTKHDDMKKDDMKKDDMKHDDMGKDDMKKN
jgi:pentapeptide MXKDX repeat protein